VPAVSAATGKVLSTGSPVDHGNRLANCDTSLLKSGGVDCGRRRRNVYDKKPRRYDKDNKTAHLPAHSDKSVAYVTNNKTLYSTFCTVEANYWQTQSIARPLCDSRATCLYPLAFDAPVMGGHRRTIAFPFGAEKLEWWFYRWWKSLRIWVWYWQNVRTWQTDRQTNTRRHRMTA